MKKFLLLALLCPFLTTAYSQQVVVHASATVTLLCDSASVQFHDSSIGNITSYYWYFSNGKTDTTKNPTTTYLHSGNYTVIHSVNNNYLDTVSFTVPINLLSVIDSSTASTHPNTCNGSATAFATGGTPPYNYLWSNGDTTKRINNLCFGHYSVTVTDSSGCSVTSSTTVNRGTCNLTATLVKRGYKCTGHGDTLTITVHNSILPLTIVWAYGDTTVTYDSIVTHITINSYIDIYDAASCYTYVIDSSLEANVSISKIQSINPPCNNPQSGLIVVNASGTTGTFTYAWNTATTGDSLTGSAGIYTVSATDNNGCSAAASFTLVSGDGLTEESYMGYPASCINNNTGSFVAGAYGGVAPYTFNFSNGTHIDTLYAGPGIYGYTITDSLGCSISDTAIINFTSYSYFITMSSTDPNCGNTGSITATPFSGRSPYHYYWSNGQTTQTISAVGSGNYSVTVTDNGGCTTTGNDSLVAHCQNIITGTIFADLNGDCIQDNNEPGYTTTYISASTSGYTYYATPSANGNYTIAVPTAGTYILTFGYMGNGSCSASSVCNNSPVIFSGVGDTAIRNYGIENTASFDLTLHPGWKPSHPGFEKEYWAYYYNQGGIHFSGPATITFTYDSNLTYEYSLDPQPVHDAVNHTLMWIVNNVPDGFSVYNPRVISYLMVPSTLSTDYYLQGSFTITPYEGDCNTENNIFTFNDPVTGSRDPNSKEVSPAGAITDNDSILTYTIHFQNDGNDTAWFIVVTDTLSPQLDPTTVQTVAASHLYKFSLSGSGILKWYINPALLPAKSVSADNSQGFIIFTVKRKTDLAMGTTISNTASIVFDYNTPVVTNTVSDTVALPTGITILTAKKDATVTIFPNPANDKLFITTTGFTADWIDLYDISGKKITEQKFTPQVDIHGLLPGVYLIELKGEQATIRQKVVKIN